MPSLPTWTTWCNYCFREVSCCRFGVSELVHLCEQVPVTTDSGGKPWEEKEAENCESRAENFQELLRSMWADEEEEAETLLKSKDHEEDQENVNEAEMEEIYEFAATQRKLLQEEKAVGAGEDADWLEGGDSEAQECSKLKSNQSCAFISQRS